MGEWEYDAQPAMIRVCPERDASCPHGMSCPFTRGRYSCDMEGSRAATAPPSSPDQPQDSGDKLP